MAFAAGDKVNWHWTPRGGYGRTILVAATVVSSSEQRVRIKTAMRDKWTKAWKPVWRSVKPEHLTPRTSPSPELAET